MSVLRAGLVCLLLPAMAVAQEDMTPAEFCPEVGRLAEKLMELRQGGVLLSEVLPLLSAESQDIAILAYEQPAYRTREVQLETIRDFRNAAELACYTHPSWRE